MDNYLWLIAIVVILGIIYGLKCQKSCKNYELLLLVELNDKTHQQNSRKSRDIKVHNILNEAGIKLMTFYTDKPNMSGYVINRVLNEIKKGKNGG